MKEVEEEANQLLDQPDGGYLQKHKPEDAILNNGDVENQKTAEDTGRK